MIITLKYEWLKCFQQNDHMSDTRMDQGEVTRLVLFKAFRKPSQGTPGCLNGLRIWLLISAQVMISPLWDETEPHIRLCTESGACLRFSLSLPLPLSPTYMLSLSLSLSKIKHIHTKSQYRWMDQKSVNFWYFSIWLLIIFNCSVKM